MSDPKEQQRESDELELEGETVKDLDPDAEDANAVRGGALQVYLQLQGQKQGQAKG
jgi:hypothetical protein